MIALCTPRRDGARLAPQRNHPNRHAAVGHAALHGLGAVHVDRLDDRVLDPALRAVERHRVTLPGVEGIQRITQRRPRVVGHQRVHRVLDVAVVAKHAAVAEIPVVAFLIEIKRLQRRTRRQIERETALRLLRTGAAALVRARQPHPPCRRCRIEFALARRHHRHRHRAEPPVHQIEMMGGFVHKQAARVFLLAVPAPEIVRAMVRVEQPVKIHRQHLANLAAHQQLLHL